MGNNMRGKVQKRIDLALQLITDLRKTCFEIKQVLSQVELNSAASYEKIYEDCKIEIKEDIDDYNGNMRKLKQMNLDLTTSINRWYEFVKDKVQMRKFTFPLRFYLKRKKLCKEIKKANEDINNLIVQNRFITEKINNWEHQLKFQAIQKLKQEVDYKRYEELLSRKEGIISELLYLLPTIPDVCPIDVDLECLDLLEERLLQKLHF